MATEEDIAWFQSTFRPIPKPELPDDSVEYFIYHLPCPAPAVIDEAAEARARLLEVQHTAAELTKELLKDYIWQRESFRLEISKENGMRGPFPPTPSFCCFTAAANCRIRHYFATWTYQLRRLY
jgi:hypothetical protein